MQVDTAARLMSLARPGQILMSRFPFDSARQVLGGEGIYKGATGGWRDR